MKVATLLLAQALLIRQAATDLEIELRSDPRSAHERFCADLLNKATMDAMLARKPIPDLTPIRRLCARCRDQRCDEYDEGIMRALAEEPKTNWERKLWCFEHPVLSPREQEECNYAWSYR